MAEFKIGRLRYTWRGQWATATFYNRDAVTQFNGKTYVCLEPHTSGDFYDDIAHVNNLGASTPYWELMLDGKMWKNVWTPDTYYSLGNIVTYGGRVYICTTHHTSGLTQIDLANWSTYASYDKWNTNWSINFVYGVGDIVKYGGIVYRCVTNHVSAANTTIGLEADLSKWEIVNDGLDYKLDWTGSTRYKKNDLVRLDADIYKCTLGHTSTSSFDATKWSLWLPALDYGNTWNSGTTYQPGDLEIYGGYSYVSKTINNLGNVPSTSSNDWEVVTQGYKMSDEWNSGTQYQIGDVVRRSGQLFSASADSSGQDPAAITMNVIFDMANSSGTTLAVTSTTGLLVGMIAIGVGFNRGQTIVSVDSPTTVTLNEAPDAVMTDAEPFAFVGVNYVYWHLVVPGTQWKNFWDFETQYVVGDLAIYGNGTYRCIQNHVSGTRNTGSVGGGVAIDSNRPDNDVTHNMWVPYVLHDRLNAMVYQGDLATFDGEKHVPVSIGTEDYVLRSTDGMPQWKYILAVPKVYYVAPIGTDAVGYGDTWDRPFKTIKYACDIVLNGSVNQNANTLLKANKSFIVEEVWQWMAFQSANNIAPFTSSSVYTEAASRRDAGLIIDALSYDMTRGGNSQTVAATIRYFADGSTTSFFNAATDAAQQYIVASLGYLLTLVGNVLQQQSPTVLYQVANDVLIDDQISQVFNPSLVAETGSIDLVTSLMNIVTTAIANADTVTVPQPNQGISSTIFVKTGTYAEDLPIILPENTALVGDELRGAVVQPKNSVYTSTTSADPTTDMFTFASTDNLEVDMPIQFAIVTSNDYFSGITAGKTYYVLAIDGLKVSISETVGGDPVQLTRGRGIMNVYAGNCLKDMFYVRNGSGIRNMSLTGLAGTLTDINENLTRRPTGGAYVSLDPGTGPDDSTTWILKRSPYVQNVTNFGVGCTGMKIDGTLHAGGNRSIVANDFTQIISDGIGVWCTGSGSLTECVSVFTYYNYAGYFAEAGGRIRATNGNSSYGTYGVIAEGYDDTEVPVAGLVDNRSTQVQASVQSAFGVSAQLLKMQFANAGSGYNELSTNLMNYSNDFLTGWTNDGNVTVQRNLLSPSTFTDGWTLTGTTATTDSSYIYQNVPISPVGASYTGLSGINASGSGSAATFDIVVGSSAYSANVNIGGSNYVVGNEITIVGSQLGGIDGVNDCTLTVAALSGSAITGVTVTGVVPEGSALKYTFSVYAKQGTASAFDIVATFSGTSSVSSSINYNFTSKTFTSGNATGGFLPTSYSKLELPNGWYRIWFTFYDTNALNNTLQIRLYPRGKSAPIGSTCFYGSQLQIGTAPTFYLETTTNKFSAFANYNVVGAGTGAIVVGDELRSGGVFQTRVTDVGTGIGGASYLTASNNAQGGTSTNILLAGSDTNSEHNYLGMRVFINSGTGAGQYGYISAYDAESSKSAEVLKESFIPLSISGADNGTGLLTLASGTTDTLYANQAVQFIPTYYSTTISKTGDDYVTATATTGGIVNTMTVSDTSRLDINMPVRFFGTTFGGVTETYTYYIKEIVNSNTIILSTEIFGNVWMLTTATGTMTMSFPGYNNYVYGSTTNMQINMPIQFTGTSVGGLTVGSVYYVNEIIDSGSFTVSTTLIQATATVTTASNGRITVDSTTSMAQLNPIMFSGTTFGGIVAGTKYYVYTIPTSSAITLTSSIISDTVYTTAGTTNLITVDDTSSFTLNAPIYFTGNTFGGLSNGALYYILSINDGTSFTVSSTVNGSAVNLVTASGQMSFRTAGPAVTLSDATGTMTGSTTNARSVVTIGYGAMNGTFSTSLFGNVVPGNTYYISTINSNSFSVSETSGGGAFTLKTDTGSMNVAAIGWDHINPGTPIAPTLDSSSVYYIEPRTTYDMPGFSQSSGTTTSIALGTSWAALGYGNNTWVAVPSGNATGSYSTDGINWTAYSLPKSAQWTDIAYGSDYWVMISKSGVITDPGSSVAVSNSNGAGWRVYYLPSKSNWSNIVYGNGKFVTIANGSSTTAYSINLGTTWSSGSGLPNANWTGLTYGKGTFVAVSSGVTYTGLSGTNLSGSGTSATFDVTSSGSTYTAVINASGSNYALNDQIKILGTSLGGTSPTNDVTLTVTGLQPTGGTGLIATVSAAGTAIAKTAAYSTNGTSWTSVTLPRTADWSDVEYGNNVFVAVCKTSGTSAYSQDGITWYSSNLSVAATQISYGQGVFVAVNSANGTGYTTEDGYNWISRTISNDGYGAIAFGYDAGADYVGKFVTVAGQSVASVIRAGCRAKGRAVISSGKVKSFSMWEAGSNYAAPPTLTLADPNVTNMVTVVTRTSNGVLGNPSFVNRGNGYNTNSTSIVINGGGYADTYQTGLTIIVKNLTKLPSPGDNLVIAGNSKIYKVTSASAVFGTTAPNIKANVQIAPDMTTALSPDHEAAVTIRQAYSQCRLTGHDFLNVGYGNAIESNYPGMPADTVLAPQDQAVEVNFGRVFYTSTDQDGNFRVGSLFAVEQATGIVTLSASQFGLTGLETLSLGGIAVGGSSVVVRQFSTDTSFVANSNNIIPTQRAIKAYLTGRLSQGGSNTFTGQLIAGTVLLGGPDRIASTIPEGTDGSRVVMKNTVHVQGQFAGWDGDGMAMAHFIKGWNHR
jgi:hypothetical protein